ncbi:hypothetical protein BC628DRAFT_1418072 [Trametes gibbosa]|nr:hypothetical protein BC628DRAFT_1418072 [Trametes gibbosa]
MIKQGRLLPKKSRKKLKGYSKSNAVPLAPPASVGCRDRTRAPGRLEPALTIIPEDRTAGMPLKLRIKKRYMVNLESSEDEALLSASCTSPGMAVSNVAAVHKHDGVEEAHNSEEEFSNSPGASELGGSDEAELSDSGDDLDFSNVAAIGVKLAAERPHWISEGSSGQPNKSKQSEYVVKSKGKARALTESDFHSEAEVPPKSSEDETNDSYVSAALEEVFPVRRNPASIWASEREDDSLFSVIPQQPIPSKHVLQHNSEQPVWKTATHTGAATSCAVQVTGAPVYVPSTRNIAENLLNKSHHRLLAPAQPLLLPTISGTSAVDDNGHDNLNAEGAPITPPVTESLLTQYPTAGSTALASTVYVLTSPATAGGNLLLNAQHTHVSETVRASFARLEAQLVFDNAFPDALGRARFVAKAMMDAAQALGYTALYERILSDAAFTRTLGALVSL